ncbi:HEAT repeat domain-containing protein [Paenibacillus sp. NPDC056579]|uniref:HEAT repeat domain-containing protein n=1 Tax=unclassified Paenibacillus TaxID=185978 RepID=UPI001EF8400E|nr:HEAT repeat domain-containing protein [Paenibacillus sp. H1-7]ULL13939.1 HEAT repeat domain-containing protein [Paenibacillus sp. H1-7]
MSQQDLGMLGRQYLQAESYGAAAFCFYRVVLVDRSNGNAWNGLILSLSLMRKEHDAQTLLARYAQYYEILEFDRDLITFAMMLWQQNPGALGEWVRCVSQMKGVSESDQELFAQMVEELSKAHEDLVERHGQEALQAQGLLSLEGYAERRVELDWLVEESIDTIYEHIKQWLEDPEAVLSGVRLLALMPDPRSEKLLRRVCRNEEVDGKVRTHALLALRWLGVRGNARIHKFDESFVINLDNPEPELTVSVPASFKPALDRARMWLAKEQGVITEFEYESHASTDEKEIPDTLAAKLEKAEFPSLLQEVAHALIRAAYDKYYPLVPTIKESRQWAAAILMLIKEYVVSTGDTWPYGEPEQDETAVRHRNWLLSGNPNYVDSLKI